MKKIKCWILNHKYSQWDYTVWNMWGDVNVRCERCGEYVAVDGRTYSEFLLYKGTARALDELSNKAFNKNT